MKLLGRTLLIEPLPEKERKTESGIFIPQTVKKTVNKAVVKYVGSETNHDFVAGQNIIYRDGAGQPIQTEDIANGLIIFEHDIIAII